MNRQSSVDNEPLNGFDILVKAHDHLWNDKLGLEWRNRFEVTSLLWNLALQIALEQGTNVAGAKL